MKSGNTFGKLGSLLAALLLGMSGLAAEADESGAKKAPGAAAEFKRIDANGDGFLSQEEFIAYGEKDDLTFKAADINGDGRVDKEEYAKHLETKAKDELKSEAADQPKPGLADQPQPSDVPGK
jgi:Ca2+-binding EF-hand superfamily protein